MGSWLLSLASAETISWSGFIILIVALLGEASVFLIPSSREKLHAELAFGFAILAAAGVAVETIGNDAIVTALQQRADSAEASLKAIEGPRDITASQHASLVECLKKSPHKGAVLINPGLLNGDAPQIAEDIRKVFEEAGGFELKPIPQGTAAMTWSTPGVFLVVIDLHHAPSHATEIQKCFWVAGRKIFGYEIKDQPADLVTIGIGGKV
jgi:hypothetical protein